MDEIIDYGFPQFTDSQHLKNLVNTDAEKIYTGTFDYIVSKIPLEKLKLVDSVSEKDSERSIKKPTNDIFIDRPDSENEYLNKIFKNCVEFDINLI